MTARHLPTAGFPSYDVSRGALQADELADVIEVGVPFGDPLADGPTIQRSTFQALEEASRCHARRNSWRKRSSRPVVIFSYLNRCCAGVEPFCATPGLGSQGTADGPARGSAPPSSSSAAEPLDLIRLVAPTRADRLARSVSGAQGCLYLVSRLGVTGASATLASDLEASIARVRAASPLPIAVGFGISTAEQAARVGRLADGVVVGSALVDRLATDGVRGVRDLLSSLRGAVERNGAAA
jgi:tryptophan synthase alpha chain